MSVMGFLASKKDPCYFCNFCRHFGALVGFFFFLVLNFVTFVVPAIYCDICNGCFKLARKIFVTFPIFAIFADISGPFLASYFSKS